MAYYKSLTDLLAPHFMKAYNSVGGASSIQNDSIREHIYVIPKEGKDLTVCQNNRPIFLLNVGLKLFAKILASRLMPEIHYPLAPSGLYAHKGGHRQRYQSHGSNTRSSKA